VFLADTVYVALEQGRRFVVRSRSKLQRPANCCRLTTDRLRRNCVFDLGVDHIGTYREGRMETVAISAMTRAQRRKWLIKGFACLLLVVLTMFWEVVVQAVWYSDLFVFRPEYGRPGLEYRAAFMRTLCILVSPPLLGFGMDCVVFGPVPGALWLALLRSYTGDFIRCGLGFNEVPGGLFRCWWFGSVSRLRTGVLTTFLVSSFPVSGQPWATGAGRHLGGGVAGCYCVSMGDQAKLEILKKGALHVPAAYFSLR